MRSILFLLLLCSMPFYAQRAFEKSAAIGRLRAVGAEWRVAEVDFQVVRLPGGRRSPSAAPEQVANTFLAEYGSAFGLADSANWQLQRVNRGQNGWSYLRYEHRINGEVVLNGGFTVAVDTGGEVRSFVGTLLSPTVIAPATAPAFPARTDLADLARQAILTDYPHATQWNVAEGQPVWTSPHPWRESIGQLVRTRTFDVTEPAGALAVRVHLDAVSGKPVLQYPLHCELNRRQYNTNTNLASLVWSEGDAFPGSLNAEQQEIIRATGETFHLYHRTFGRQGYDGADGLMRGVSSANLSNCPNASASGNTIFHCTGVVSDDIVGHEWTHNYIGSMNGLIYAFESGAINEAYADIFGESIDLLNTRGLDTNDGTIRTACNNTGLRWKLGEDANFGVLRDMWQPECRNDPSDRASSDYACGSGDNGGVHSNSGLVNRTFTLLVDGGTLNGQTITGIGLTKALHIFFHANNNYITRVTEFAELAAMLEASANDLLGINLTALTLLDMPAAASGEIITAADVTQVINATLATQLAGSGPCTSTPTLEQNPPALCTDPVENTFALLFSEDWEAGMAGWSVVENPVSPTTWDAKPWELNASLPDGRAGQGISAPNPFIGDCNTDLDNGTVDLTSPVITLPANQTDFLLQFNHQYSLENNYDGGVLYLSRNGGAFTLIDNSSFVYNGYDDALVGPGGNDNPLAGLTAFNGADASSTAGTWGTSIVDLTAAGAMPGDDVQIRWTIGHDGCNGWDGWYLDEVEVGYCSSAALSVTYTSLRAAPAKNHLRLDWQTDTEIQNTGFYVERQGANGTDFQELGFVAAGNGNYTYADYQVVPAVIYVYRLRQVDADGTSHYSELVSARLDGEERSLSVYPNPVTASFTILSAEEATEATLYDATGRLMMTFPLQDGQTQVVASPELKQGVYLLRVGKEVVRVMIFYK